LNHSISPFLWFFFFLEIGSPELFAKSCLPTTILLIFAAWITRVTGMSHQCPLLLLFWRWGSLKLFAQCGLKYQSSPSQPPK
jgi:hypothetical protein